MTNLSKFHVEVFPHYFEKRKSVFWGKTLNNFETPSVYFELSLFCDTTKSLFWVSFQSFWKMRLIILDSNSLFWYVLELSLISEIVPHYFEKVSHLQGGSHSLFHYIGLSWLPYIMSIILYMSLCWLTPPGFVHAETNLVKCSVLLWAGAGGACVWDSLMGQETSQRGGTVL